ncbi:MAG: 3-hydroxydecanoyl-[ACP] dehydratase, partial [uncultured Acetobacteraceae bacterium]
ADPAARSWRHRAVGAARRGHVPARPGAGLGRRNHRLRGGRPPRPGEPAAARRPPAGDLRCRVRAPGHGAPRGAARRGRGAAGGLPEQPARRFARRHGAARHPGRPARRARARPCGGSRGLHLPLRGGRRRAHPVGGTSGDHPAAPRM